MPKIFTFFILSFFITGIMNAQDYSLYKKELHKAGQETLPYRLLLPKDYSPDKEYPLVLFLHGSGERGQDNQHQLTHGASLFLDDTTRKDYPAIVVFPQCKNEQSWNNSTVSNAYGKTIFNYPAIVEPNAQLDLVESLLDTLMNRYSIDEHRLYIGGLSMGGMGTFEMLHRNPNTFAAAFAICGGANPRIASKIKDTPIWIFHGEEDDIVPSIYSERMHKALQYVQADAKLTVYPRVKHDSWTNTFAEPELLSWLFSKMRKE